MSGFTTFFERSHPKGANFAVLVFLIFGLLWLALAGVGLSGVKLAEGATQCSLAQGLLALLAVTVLAARLQIGPRLALGIGIGIILAPFFVPSAVPGGQGFNERTIRENLARELAKPVVQRERHIRSLTESLKTMGYNEPPEIQKQHEERTSRIKSWMEADPGRIRELRRAVSEKYHVYGTRPQEEGGPTDEEFEKMVLESLNEPQGGRSWLWINDWLAMAKDRGLQEAPVPLSPVEEKRAYNHARKWLESHWKEAKTSVMGQPSGASEGSDEFHGFKAERTFAVASSGLWIVLLGLGGVWAGRNAFSRPWDPAQFPVWVKEGLAALLRKDRFALLRIILGLAIMAAGGFLAVFLFASGQRGRGVAKLVATVIMLGATTIFSALTLSEEEGPQHESGASQDFPSGS